MKIALCSKGKFSLDKGSTKNRIELADSLQQLGWDTLLVDKEILGISMDNFDERTYSYALKEFLTENSYKFDVVLYEYDTLPFERSCFNESTLFVARPALLAFHLPQTKFRYDLKTRLSYLFKDVIRIAQGKKDGSENYYRKINYCLHQADVIQVQNTQDRELLISKGFLPGKIIIVPNGVSTERIKRFNEYQKSYQEPFKVAFVGTFDFRKGAVDFPIIFKILKKHFPSIRLKLLGTKGLFETKEAVLRFFPRKHHNSIEIIPTFDANELPQLLSDCQVGLFPSYLESFGFGALEMMCAGLPVVAYDSPGPSDFVLPDFVCPKGDVASLANKIVTLCKDQDYLEEKALQSRKRVIENYNWDDIALKVNEVYCFHLQKLRRKSAIAIEN